MGHIQDIKEEQLIKSYEQEMTRFPKVRENFFNQIAIKVMIMHSYQTIKALLCAMIGTIAPLPTPIPRYYSAHHAFIS